MFKPGDTPIPGYHLIRFIGQGAYGEVWESQAPGGAKAALKFIPLQTAAGGVELKSANAVKLIRHANLVPITAIWALDRSGNVLSDDALDLIENEPPPEATIVAAELERKQELAYLVIGMSLADECLDAQLKRYREEGATGIPRDQLLEYMRDAAKGIDYLNEPRHLVNGETVGIVHRDVKPANLLLLGDSVVVGDFGVATSLRDFDAQATRVAGSLGFMAPEALARRPTPSTDQYALAITYYYLRAGIMPYDDGHTFDSLVQVHREGRLDFSEVPEPERAVLKKATAVPPAPRYPNCAGFVSALSDACRPDATTPDPKQANWINFAIATAALAIVGLAAAWFAGVGSDKTALTPATPTPTTPTSHTLSFTPADAQFELRVLSDDASSDSPPMTGNGTATFPLDEDQTVQLIVKTDSPIYEPYEQTLSLTQLQAFNWHISLPHKPVWKIRSQAFELLAEKQPAAANRLLLAAAMDQPVDQPNVLQLPNPFVSTLPTRVTELAVGPEDYVVATVNDQRQTRFRFSKPKLQWFNETPEPVDDANSAQQAATASVWHDTSFTGVANLLPASEPGQWLVIMKDSVGKIVDPGGNFQQLWVAPKTPTASDAPNGDSLVFSASTVSADGRTLACGDLSGSVHLWTVAMDGSLNDYQSVSAHDGSILRLNFVDGANTLMSVSTDRTISRIALNAENSELTASPIDLPPAIENQELVEATVASGERLIVASEERLWSVKTTAPSLQPIKTSAIGGLISLVRSSPNSDWLLVGTDSVSKSIQFLNLKTDANLFPDPSSVASPATATFSDDGNWVAVSDYSGGLLLVDLSAETPMWCPLPKSTDGYRKFLQFTSDNQYLIAILDTGQEEIWPVDRCRLILQSSINYAQARRSP